MTEEQGKKYANINDHKTMAMIFCPYFGWLKNGHITCEFLGAESAVTIRFTSISQKYKILYRWCIPPDGNKSCPIAAANIKYWEHKNAKGKP